MISDQTQAFDLGLPFGRPDDLADLIRSPLTRNIEARFPDVRDEIIAAFSDHIPVKSNGNHFLIFQDLSV